MIAATAAFIAAEAAASATKKRKVLVHLRNVAHRAEGATATAPGQFSASFPASGVVYGKRTHLYFGAPSGADNGDGDPVAEDGIGLIGWKSAAASMVSAIDTAAEWGAATTVQTHVKVLGCGVNLELPENLLFYSDALDNAEWTKNNMTITADAIATWDGTEYADKLTEVAAASDHWALLGLVSPVYAPASATLVGSAEVKYGTTQFHCLEIAGPGGGVRCWFDLVNGTVKAAGVNGVYGAGWTRVAATITALSGGWGYRCVLAATTDAGGTIYFVNRPTQSDDTISWTGNTGKYTYVARSCLRVGSAYTGYTKTTATPEVKFQDQDFDAATDNTTIVGFDSWANVTGTATIKTMAIAAYPAAAAGRVGLQLKGAGSNTNREVKRLGFSPGTNLTGYMSFRLKQITAADVTAGFGIGLWQEGTAARYQIFVKGTSEVTWQGAGAEQYTQTRDSISSGWNVFEVRWTGGVITSMTIDIYLNGKNIDHQTGITLAGLDSIRLDIFEAATGGSPEYWLDDLRIGTSIVSSGTEEVTIDWGAVPASTRATVAFTGETFTTSRLVSGAYYGMANADTTLGIGQYSGSTLLYKQIGESFTPAANTVLSGVRVKLGKSVTVGGFIVNIWAEIRAITAGLPGSYVLARSRPVSLYDLSATGGFQDFEFMRPFTSDGTGTTIYALVINSDNFNNAWGNGTTLPSIFDYCNVYVDASATGYTGGQLFYVSASDVWTAVATKDMVFSFTTKTQTEEGYATSNQDSTQNLVRDSSNNYVSQGFKVTRTVDVRHAQVWAKVPAGASFVSGDVAWIEIQGDDGTGKPNNIVLAESARLHMEFGYLTAAYALMMFSLGTAYRLTAGTQYHLVVKGTWTASATRFLHLGYDGSAPTYANGAMCKSDTSATPVWSTVSGAALCFAILDDAIGYTRHEIAYSADNVTFSAYATLTDNPARAGSMAAFSLTGSALQYWKIRSTMTRVIDAAVITACAPTLLSLTTTLVFATEQYIEIDLGTDRTISTVAISAHPTKGGCREFYLKGLAAAGSYPSGFAAITAIDTVEARAKGGTATASFSTVTGIIAGTGDWYRVNFSADQTVRYLRIYVRDNIDSYARIINVEARRTVDLTSRVMAPFSISHDSDPLTRVFGARNLSLQLQNSDGYLTQTLGAAAWSAEVGAGCILYTHLGYEGTELLQMGVFHVNQWLVNLEGTCSITATDGFKLMNQNVQTEYRANATITDLIEYLGNLCNVPSMWMNLDRSTTTIPLFTAENPNAWTEAQKIRQSVAWSSLYWGEDGYLTLRLSGTSAHGTGSESITGCVRMWGPCQVVGDYAYAIYQVADLRLGMARYDLKLGTWSKMAAGATTSSQTRGAIAQAFDGNIYGLVWEWATGNAYDAATSLALWKYDIAADTWTRVAAIGSWTNQRVAANGERAIRCNPPCASGETFIGATGPSSSYPFSSHCVGNTLEGGFLMYFITGADATAPANSGSFVFEVDFASYKLSSHAPAGTGIDSNPLRASAIVKESGAWVIAHQDLAIPAARVSLWNPYSDVLTSPINLVTIAATVTEFTMAGGIAATGLGYIYLTLWQRSCASYLRPELFKITVTTTTLALVTPRTYLAANTVATDKIASGQANFGALAYVDGALFLPADVSVLADGSDVKEAYWYDEKETTPTPRSMGPINPGSSFYWFAQAFTYAGLGRMLVFTDRIRIMDVTIRKSVARAATPSYAISLASGGVGLASARMDTGDERGGASRVVNFAIVTSNALAQDAMSKIVCTLGNMPWYIPAGQASSMTLKVRCSLSDPIDPGDTGVGGATKINVVKTGVGLVTASFSKLHPTQPEIKLVITGGSVEISSITIEGKPFYSRKGLITFCLGSDLSEARYGKMSKEITNEYFQDLPTMGLVGSSIVSRFQLPGKLIEGVQSVAILRAQLLDLLTLTVPAWAVSGNYVVFGLTQDAILYRTTWKVLEA